LPIKTTAIGKVATMVAQFRSHRSHRSNPDNFLEKYIVFQKVSPLAAVAAQLRKTWIVEVTVEAATVGWH